jgi:hypothetical protein
MIQILEPAGKHVTLSDRYYKIPSLRSNDEIELKELLEFLPVLEDKYRKIVSK